jgi:hypothetical protein
MEREKLEREIHQLTQIIRANTYALVSKSTPIMDRGQTAKAIDIRTTMWAGLLKQLSGAQAWAPRNREAHVRKPKHIHEAKLTKGALPPIRSALLAQIKEIKQTHAKSKSKIGVHRP